MYSSSGTWAAFLFIWLLIFAFIGHKCVKSWYIQKDNRNIDNIPVVVQTNYTSAGGGGARYVATPSGVIYDTYFRNNEYNSNFGNSYNSNNQNCYGSSYSQSTNYQTQNAAAAPNNAAARPRPRPDFVATPSGVIYDNNSSNSTRNINSNNTANESRINVEFDNTTAVPNERRPSGIGRQSYSNHEHYNNNSEAFNYSDDDAPPPSYEEAVRGL